MREILFKAKRLDNREWVEGYFAIIGVKNAIIDANPEKYIAVDDDMESSTENEFVEVDASTICQYTGLTDKNGQKIWENDIVSFWDTYSTENGQAETDCIGEVLWDNEELLFYVTNRMSAESYEVLEDCVVIGNILDNQELRERNVN